MFDSFHLSPGTPKKKETKKKFKLEPHDDQVFLDGNEVRLENNRFEYN